MSTFKERLEEAVDDAKLTRQEARRRFAAELGMTRSNLTHWFTGRAKEPKGGNISGVAGILGVNPLWLATGKGPKRLNDKETGVPKKLSQEAMEVAAMYETMDKHVQDVVRRHMRDVNEALGAPSAENPYGKGRRPRATKKPPRKATSAKKKPLPGTQ